MHSKALHHQLPKRKAIILSHHNPNRSRWPPYKNSWQTHSSLGRIHVCTLIQLSNFITTPSVEASATVATSVAFVLATMAPLRK